MPLVLKLVDPAKAQAAMQDYTIDWNAVAPRLLGGAPTRRLVIAYPTSASCILLDKF
ncbi:MAG: hypothetical protein ACRDT0_09655 [Pseudonocardiaceae bacterium]